MPHPAIPPLESLRAYRRNLAALGRDYSRNSWSDAIPDQGYEASFDLCVLNFITETCFGPGRYPVLDADMSVAQVVESFDDEEEARYWKAAVVKEARDGSARSLAKHLDNRLSYFLPMNLGFDRQDPPTHTTFSRHWDYSPEEEEVIEELGLRARYAALWVGAEFPQHLRKQGWGVEEILSSEPSLDEKMVAMRHLVEEAIGVMSPHLSFGRDPDAAAYKLTPSSFVSLFAHLALEHSYLKTGRRTLKWLDLPAPVPSPSTVSDYISELSVTEIDNMLTASTAALLRQEHETSAHVDPIDAALDPPIHLAYDTTKIDWYGDSSTAWTSNVLPRHNTASAWVFGVLSIVSENTTYVLGALPLKDQREIGGYLERFLRQVRGAYKIDIGRVYLDSELYTKEALNALRSSNADFLIKAKDVGEVSDLLDDATPDEPEARMNVSFGDLSLSRRPDAFAWPIPSEEVGADDRDRDHEPFLTDIDVETTDLKTLGRKFRDRWGIETSIREIKNRYHARCNSSDATVRAFYFMMATVLYNISQYVDNRIGHRLHADSVEWSGEELLHVAREVDPDGVPDWGDEYDPAEADDWVGIV